MVCTTGRMALFDQAQLKRAIAELKATTRVTMETVGVRFGRRVSTSVYRENLLREPGKSRMHVWIHVVCAPAEAAGRQRASCGVPVPVAAFACVRMPACVRLRDVQPSSSVCC